MAFYYIVTKAVSHELLRFIFSLHKGQFSFYFSQKLIHCEWNLWVHDSALTICPVSKLSRQIAHLSLLSFLLSSLSFLSYDSPSAFGCSFSSYLKLGMAFMMFFISSGDLNGCPSSSRFCSSSPYSLPYSYWLWLNYPFMPGMKLALFYGIPL